MNANVITVGRDGILYGISGGNLFSSIDGGETTTTSTTQPDAGTYGGPSALFRTGTGWVLVTRKVTAPDEESSVFHLAELGGSWTHKFTTTTVGAWVDPISCSQHHSDDLDLVLLGEYGRRGADREVWMSTDGGLNYTSILTVERIDEDEEANNHVHCTVYDPFDERIWVGVGDGTNNARLMWSDDMGETWSTHSDPLQPTSITPLADRTVFGIDESWMTTGAYRLLRNDESMTVQRAIAIDDRAGSYQYGVAGPVLDSGQVGYVMFPRQLGTNPHQVWATGNSGISWRLVYEHADDPVRGLCGPDGNGYLFATTTSNLLVRCDPLTWHPRR